MSIFIILGKDLVKKIQPFMLWESNYSHCLAAYSYPTYRGVLTVRTTGTWYLRGLNRRPTACLYSSLVWAARSGARVQYLAKLKAVPRYGSARIYHESTPQTCARYKM